MLVGPLLQIPMYISEMSYKILPHLKPDAEKTITLPNTVCALYIH